jgi:hypothetical protein
MDFGSVLLILAFLILIAIFVSRPFFEKGSSTAQAETDLRDQEISRLLAERDRVLDSLQELDMDNALGKIPQEDYPDLRARFLQHGANVLRQLDSLQGSADVSGTVNEDQAELRIEAAVADRRGGSGLRTVPAAVGKPDDELEALLASRRRDRQEKSAGFCPKCGAPVQKSDLFCPKCGKKVG